MPPKDSNLVLLIKLVSGVLFLLPFLFISAGTLDWTEGWLVVLTFSCYAVPTTLYLRKKNPELLRKRTSYKMPERSLDRLFIIGSTLLIIALLTTAPLDAVRYQWSQVDPVLKKFGFAGMILSLTIVFLVMKENAYLSRVVEVQKGQIVISSGPYRFIRHPMYAALILMFLCLPFALGSFYALIPAVATDMFLIIRTHYEDETLLKELQGYKDYAERTRYRLVPGVW